MYQATYAFPAVFSVAEVVRELVLASENRITFDCYNERAPVVFNLEN